MAHSSYHTATSIRFCDFELVDWAGGVSPADRPSTAGLRVFSAATRHLKKDALLCNLFFFFFLLHSFFILTLFLHTQHSLLTRTTQHSCTHTHPHTTQQAQCQTFSSRLLEPQQPMSSTATVSLSSSKIFFQHSPQVKHPQPQKPKPQPLRTTNKKVPPQYPQQPPRLSSSQNTKHSPLSRMQS